MNNKKINMGSDLKKCWVKNTLIFPKTIPPQLASPEQHLWGKDWLGFGTASAGHTVVNKQEKKGVK